MITEMTINQTEMEKSSSEEWDEFNKEMRRDMLALDLRISLFIGAVQSFKYESLLKPVSAIYKKSDGEIDIEKIRKLVSRLPELSVLTAEKPDADLANFLKTTLLNPHQKLGSISLEDLRKQIGGLIELQTAPRWIFQIDHISRNQAWERRKSDSSTFYAFHGSRFENFHSILNLGLHQHLNKVLYKRWY